MRYRSEKILETAQSQEIKDSTKSDFAQWVRTAQSQETLRSGGLCAAGK
ncbi:hypothetical protein P0M11_10130 [Kaistella sp. PBT33-4]|nr:hypothetical protein [Kaistella sp. PBT33-4]MDF0720352.1 hypothetical protein [Kaistella sp. PBT33-4]